jgi:hypothetical protein
MSLKSTLRFSPETNEFVPAVYDNYFDDDYQRKFDLVQKSLEPLRAEFGGRLIDAELLAIIAFRLSRQLGFLVVASTVPMPGGGMTIAAYPIP